MLRLLGWDANPTQIFSQYICQIALYPFACTISCMCEEDADRVDVLHKSTTERLGHLPEPNEHVIDLYAFHSSTVISLFTDTSIRRTLSVGPVPAVF